SRGGNYVRQIHSPIANQGAGNIFRLPIFARSTPALQRRSNATGLGSPSIARAVSKANGLVEVGFDTALVRRSQDRLSHDQRTLRDCGQEPSLSFCLQGPTLPDSG